MPDDPEHPDDQSTRPAVERDDQAVEKAESVAADPPQRREDWPDDDSKYVTAGEDIAAESARPEER